MDQGLKGVKRAYCGATQIICSLGSTTQSVFDSMCRYETLLSRFDDGTPLCRIDRAALDVSGLEEFTFAEQLAILTLRSVEVQSGVAINTPRTALIISTTKGNIDKISEDFPRSYLWAMGDRIASYFGYNERVTIVSNACVSGVTAIAVAARMIERGEVDQAYVVGVDIVSEFVVSGFNSFKSISPTVCRPYDESRDGLTLGEGCGAIFLTKDEALSPNKILVAGYGMSDDANHISGPSRSGDGLYFAIDKAMRMAGVDAAQIGMVNAHGTATPFNDEMESKALNWAKIADVPCNSLKPYIGHTLGASGVIEAIISIEEMSRGVIFGVKGYERSGVPFELNVSAEHREMEVNHCIKCASGFGGTNAAIVLSKGAACRAVEREARSIEIEEVASIRIESDGQESTSSELLKSLYKELGDVNMKFYKMNNLAKAGYVASCEMLSGLDVPCAKERVAVVLANRSASLDADLLHQANVDRRLPEGTSPAVFVYTLANIVAAEIAIKHKFQGESTTFVMESRDMEYLATYARGLIAGGECDGVLYGWCELLEECYDVELKLIIKGTC